MVQGNCWVPVNISAHTEIVAVSQGCTRELADLSNFEVIF